MQSSRQQFVLWPFIVTFDDYRGSELASVGKFSVSADNSGIVLAPMLLIWLGTVS